MSGNSLDNVAKLREGAALLKYTPAGSIAATTVQGAINELAEIKIDLAAATGASLVGFQQEGIGAVATTVQAKLRERVSVKDFGAVGDGVTNDASAAIAMKTAVGYVRFPAGVYLIGSNTTINTPIYFDDQASVSVGSGFTLTIAEAFITAPRQQIFSGGGYISLTGERTVNVMAEWFGVIPGNSAGDLAPNMNKLFAACPSARECLVSIGPGSFYFKTAPNAVPRAVRLVGSGERITNFVFMNSLSSSGDFLTTAGEGVWIEGVQFTCTSGSSRRTSGSLIKLAHQYCKVRNVWFTDSFSGVDVSGNFCEVDGVVASRNSSASGSYLVKLSSGFAGARVRNVQYNDSTVGLGPEYAVRVDGHSNFIIDSVTTSGAIATVGIVPASGICSGGQINNIRATGSTGVNGVVINSTGTGAVEKLLFGSIIADGLTGYGFKMQKDGSGILKYIEIQHLDARACTLGGFKVDSSNGRPDHWHLKGGYCRNSAANGYEVANSQHWTITGCEAVSNTGTGTLIANTCSNFIYTSNRNVFNTAANLTDNSGSVTKVLTNNI